MRTNVGAVPQHATSTIGAHQLEQSRVQPQRAVGLRFQPVGMGFGDAA